MCVGVVDDMTCVFSCYPLCVSHLVHAWRMCVGVSSVKHPF